MLNISANEGILQSELTGVSTDLLLTNQNVISVKNLKEIPSELKGGLITIWEQIINGELNPDVASIGARTNTPPEILKGESQCTQVFLTSRGNFPIGVVLMNPNKELITGIYDPLNHGGPQGFTVEAGWLVQTIIPTGGCLEFLDYWSPRGFCDPDLDGKLFGETALIEIPEEELPSDFVEVRDNLERVVNAITQERIGGV
jgi:hypothetical protein